MTSRRFAPLFWCQFLSAFNDNFIRNMLAMLILFRFGGENASLKILHGTIVFILPAIPLSALGGEIADSHDKALIARRLKFAEIFIQMIAAAGGVVPPGGTRIGSLVVERGPDGRPARRRLRARADGKSRHCFMRGP